MVDFTAEEIKVLEKYENIILTAYKSRYCTGLTDSVFEELYAIYRRIFKKNLSKSCNSCRLKLAYELGRLYEERIHID